MHTLSAAELTELALSPRERQALSAELHEIRAALSAGTFDFPTPAERDRYRATLARLLARLEVEPAN